MDIPHPDIPLSLRYNTCEKLKEQKIYEQMRLFLANELQKRMSVSKLVQGYTVFSRSHAQNIVLILRNFLTHCR